MLRIALTLAALATILPEVAAAQAPDERTFGDYAAIQALAARCPGITAPNPAAHVFIPHVAVTSVLGQVLAVDPGRCPGGPQAALAELDRRLGDVEKGDIDLRLLRLAWRAAEQGQGMARDPALADRYGRILWLYSAGSPPLPRWPEQHRRGWMSSPEAVALMEARVAASEQRIIGDYVPDYGLQNRDIRVVVRRLAEVRLDRAIAGYDPVRAIGWLERLGDAIAVGTALSDGIHAPPDYRRAARLLLPAARAPNHAAAAERTLLLRIGRKAAAAAKTPLDRAEAMRILFAATAHRPAAAIAAERAALMRGIGPVAQAQPARRDAECAANFTRMEEIAPMLAPFDGIRPPKPAMIGLRGLIGPDSQLVWVEITRSSGSAAFDAALLGAWASVAGRIRMWETARNRFTLVDFPSIPVSSEGKLSDACLGNDGPQS